MVNAEQMQMVKDRHDAKASLLAEMRADREAQQLDRHSHIGVELARLIQPRDLRLMVYQQLAGLANLLAAHQQDGAGRIFASFTRGIERGTHEMWGPEAATELREAIALEPTQNGGKTPQQPQPGAGEGQDPVRPQEPISTPASGDGPVQPAEAPEREHGMGLITDMPGESEPPYHVDMTTRAADIEAELDLRSVDLPAADDRDDLPSALEPAKSPEPAETPQARAARLRRAAKAAQAAKST